MAPPGPTPIMKCLPLMANRTMPAGTGVATTPPADHEQLNLTPEEIRAFIEWIDLGALWSHTTRDQRTERNGAGR